MFSVFALAYRNRDRTYEVFGFIESNMLWPSISTISILTLDFNLCYNRYRHNPIAIDVYCRQWLSMEAAHNVLWSAMATGRHGSQSIAAGNGHRWARFTIYCGKQYLSMGNVTRPNGRPIAHCRLSRNLLLGQCYIWSFVHHLLWSTMAIDGHLTQAIVAGNGHR